MCYILGIILAILVIVITRFVFCGKIKLKFHPMIKRLLGIFRTIVCSVTWIFSPDYRIAKIQKTKTNFCRNETQNEVSDEQLKQLRAAYIKKANTVNLLASLIVVFISSTLFLTIEELWIFNVLIVLVGYRLCSRTLEINISFVKDVFDEEKLSSLKKVERIKLAFTSLIEEAILFFGIYLLMFNDVWKAILGGLHSFALSPIECTPDNYCPFIALYQVICTIILLTISFASYISMPETSTSSGAPQNTSDDKKEPRP